MNLIEQSNILKGLTDEHLNEEVSSPKGNVAPFMVLSEISRRKEQRDQYDGNKARHKQKSTVLEDLMINNPVSHTGAPMQPPAPTAPTGIAAFADGGLVGGGGSGLDYDAIGARYAQTLESLPEQRKRARSLALIAAGAGMLGGTSPHALQNIGAGILPAVQYYGQELDTIDTEERTLLRDALNVGREKERSELEKIERDYREQQDIDEAARAQEALKPASIREFEHRAKLSPEQQAEFDALNTSSSTSIYSDDKMAAEIDKIYKDVLAKMPKLSTAEQFLEGAERDLMLADREKQAEVATYKRLKQAYGLEEAVKYAGRVGLTDGDILTGTTDVVNPDPLGLDL